MIHLYEIFLISSAHFVGDFVFQTDEMSKQKSKDNHVLLDHVQRYVISLFVAGWFLFDLSVWTTVLWLVLNGLLHFGTDYVTSRRTTRLWGEGRTHDFFVTIGADQLIHMLCLFTTLVLLK